jgi:hypothetical protein
MNLKEKVSTINNEIQAYTLDNYNAINNSLFNKMEELKKLMVKTYETNEGLNKYIVRLPMWLIDMNLQDVKKNSRERDRESSTLAVNKCKKVTNKAIELFEVACAEYNVNTLTQEGF